jgi:hypothetical protein
MYSYRELPTLVFKVVGALVRGVVVNVTAALVVCVFLLIALLDG